MKEITKHLSEKPSDRGSQWLEFSYNVFCHIEDYTVPQYGDAPDDQVEAWTAEDCIKAIRKYAARFGTNARGPAESKRDMLKIAHYACIAHGKIKEEA